MIESSESTADLQQNNYILIGMPASGKSSLGRRIAKQLGLRFVDTDELLKTETGQGPSGLNAKMSFKDFIRTEEETVLKLSGRGMVIATGGSVVYGSRAMQHLKHMGTVIYLEDSLHKIRQRVGGLEERGVILRPGQSFESLYNERTRLYRRYADIIFNNRRFNPGQAARILGNLIQFIDG